MSRLAYPFAPLVIGAFVAALGLPSMVAVAADQTEPPPGGSSPPAMAAPTPTPAEAPAPPIASVPPPPAAPAPAPAPAPALVTAPGELGAVPPPEEHPPLYKEPWFWAVVGVVALTATMISIGVAYQGPATPKTDLGNMRAF